MITVYTKNSCGYCTRAKMWLMQKGYDYQEINVDEDQEALEFLRAQGHRTMPQIYWQADGKREILVGGGFEGLNALSTQELDTLIRAQRIELDLSNLSL